MKNWTDKIINWHQLPATEVKRLIATWGMTERQIANYDAKHGFTNVATAKAAEPTAPAKEKAEPKKEVKPAAKKAAPAKKATVKAPTRQKHTGADGEVKFVDHRNLYVGFYGGKVVVTKRTEKQCREFLTANFGFEY